MTKPLNFYDVVEDFDFLAHYEDLQSTLMTDPTMVKLYKVYIAAYNHSTGSNITEEVAMDRKATQDESIGRCLWDRFMYWYYNNFLIQFCTYPDPVLSVPDIVIDVDGIEHKSGEIHQ